MLSPPRVFPDWKAPTEDGRLLIWPEPADLLRGTLENHTRLREAEARLQNVPLSEIRRRTRQFIGHEDDRPLLVSGHQTELYHSGVWAKDALIHSAAARVEGQAYRLAVDTDAPKHLNLRWPAGSVPITDDPRLAVAAWSGQLDPPTPAHLREVDARFHEAAHEWDFEPMLPRALLSLRRLVLESNTLASALTNAQHELDWELGLRHHALLASPLWASESFLLFACHILARAEQFARDYNVSLHEYRAQHRMKTETRPMPDLFVSDQSVEMPFWLDDLSIGRRIRPSVFRAGGAFVLQLVDGDEFTFDASADGWDAAAGLGRWLSARSHRLAPRALTLTLFMRLCAADQFVHGIGGGRYDQVTDRLIARHFEIDPPGFCVTTATLYFPDALGRQRVCVPCVRHEGHRLWHSLLGERKRELVSQISALPPRSPQRQSLFLTMHNELETAARSSPTLRRWKRRLHETQRLHREEQALFDRELFYAIQPRERLARIIDDYDRAFAV